jgi:hypothetical protein
MLGAGERHSYDGSSAPDARVTALGHLWRVEMTRTGYDSAEAFSVAQDLDVDFAVERFSLEDFREGMDLELTHCLEHPEAGDLDPVSLGRTVLEHLRADPCYYVRLLERFVS